MFLPSTFRVGIGHDKYAVASLVTALMSFTASGLGLSGTSGGVFLPQAVVAVRTSAKQANDNHRDRVFIASFS
jgi:hypothetical protein